MQIKIKLVTTPGDKTVNRVAVVMVDKYGTEHPDKMILEGETVEVEATVSGGSSLVVREMEVPMVYDSVQKAAVPLDLTPKDPLADPNRPTATPQKPGEKGEDKNAPAGGYGKPEAKKPEDTKLDLHKSPDPSTKK